MRWMPLLVLFALPLFAGDPESYAQAVKGFGDDRIEVRREASQMVRRLLRRDLAPLLAALESRDPEVSRRARSAILGLLPGQKKGSDFVEMQQGVAQQIFVAGGGQVRIVMRGNNAVFVQQGGNPVGGRVKEFGVQGHPLYNKLLRRQLGLAAGRGYAITSVKKGSMAARLGLKPHDILLAVNGMPVQNLGTVNKHLGDKKDWHKLRLRVLRETKPMELDGA